MEGECVEGVWRPPGASRCSCHFVPLSASPPRSRRAPLQLCTGCGCPARYKHNPSAPRPSPALQAAGGVFNISILLMAPRGGGGVGGFILARSGSEINTRLTAIWSPALKILKWQISAAACCVSYCLQCLSRSH